MDFPTILLQFWGFTCGCRSKRSTCEHSPIGHPGTATISRAQAPKAKFASRILWGTACRPAARCDRPHCLKSESEIFAVDLYSYFFQQSAIAGFFVMMAGNSAQLRCSPRRVLISDDIIKETKIASIFDRLTPDFNRIDTDRGRSFNLVCDAECNSSLVSESCFPSI